MNAAEVMTTALVAAPNFSGDFEQSPRLLAQPTYKLLQSSTSHSSGYFKGLRESFTPSVCLMDSLPISACDNILIPRAAFYQQERYQGYMANTWGGFHGLKIHFLLEPLEIFLTPNAAADVNTQRVFHFDFPQRNLIFAHSTYINHTLEEQAEASHQPSPPLSSASLAYLQAYRRKWVKIAGSLIERLLPKHILAVSPQSFQLKSLLAYRAS
jgi:hypothetical protein